MRVSVTNSKKPFHIQIMTDKKVLYQGSNHETSESHDTDISRHREANKSNPEILKEKKSIG